MQLPLKKGLCWKIPCYTQFWAGNACHLGSLAFATFLAVEVYRSVRFRVRCVPKYEWLYLTLGFGCTMVSATAIILVGEVWSCEPGDMLECPHQYISPNAAYFGCQINTRWALLRLFSFVIPSMCLSILCIYCFVGSLIVIRTSIGSDVKTRASRRLLVISGTTIFLLIAPWLRNVVQLTGTKSPWWIVLYHSLGNGWNGAVNVVLAWWRLGVLGDLKVKMNDRWRFKRNCAATDRPIRGVAV
ncbi:hypothetical protein KIPB_000754 [Kipferlia bialata]|uniref:Uncharacterized protein n=1 Tax=Kipferlia bialata TaxID=797122 RepID=A0A9K3CMT7_9EUKA|nr:hypothetical protein KIPB_000754 [Kipferlia bialata]|eukprot:g754.t1